jgi:2-isopropylmalate synthase
MKSVFLYDTTLRDGSQRKGLSFSLEDKLKVTSLLDSFGVSYIEGGWPGSNPKDMEYFRRMRNTPPNNARIVAFGSTCRVGSKAKDDSNLRALVDSETPAVTLVGKSSTLHVNKVLQTDLKENLRMISDSVSFMKWHGKEVIFDAEHFFDGFRENQEYALQVVATAHEAGADWIVLCDTNGGSLPDQINSTVQHVYKEISKKIGIHCHNDGELAVANTLAAVNAGATQIQCTINGYGERCGNANLVSLVPNLQIKMGYQCIPTNNLHKLTDLSRTVSEIANLAPDTNAPYVGSSAFAHKGGLHGAAVEKITSSYEHIDPRLVGNARQIVVSELAGRGNVRMLSTELGIDINGNEKVVLEQIKEMESKGYQFENAEGTVELLMRRSVKNYAAPFKLLNFSVLARDHSNPNMSAEAVVKLAVNGEMFHTVAEGRGPVHALDMALRRALIFSYPHLANVKLVDYKVRILDPDLATDATARVVIEAHCGEERWFTVGCSPNVIEASLKALIDSLELYLLREKERRENTEKDKQGIVINI